MTYTLKIPCVLMRGGTSRGPFFLSEDLPANERERNDALISVIGAGHALQVDGVGGGNPLTSKVAIVGPSTRPDADVDFLFAQVEVVKRIVDTAPNCGNMLSAVGPFAIEKGLIRALDGKTCVRIHNINTGKVVEATVQTPGRTVTYDGEARIDGIPGTAAPVHMKFLDVAGSKTGKLFPTALVRQIIQGVAVTCIDAATPLVLIEASGLGKTARESPAELNGDAAFLRRLEEIRLIAGEAMGMGDVSGSVIPKPVLLGKSDQTPGISARYFMPHACHMALAVTGAVGIATACLTEGTIAADFVRDAKPPFQLRLEHPSGRLELEVGPGSGEGPPGITILRTARRIFDGHVYARMTGSDRAA
ncbi:MAG: 4-oxalomesaconate tautomerase [Hyphomicrobiales bacterium]|nr:4-oxalomesaconate tautomerase [Hyphomicrobiales bacterium]